MAHRSSLSLKSNIECHKKNMIRDVELRLIVIPTMLFIYLVTIVGTKQCFDVLKSVDGEINILTSFSIYGYSLPCVKNVYIMEYHSYI